jgi:hypothetical protein
MKEDQSKVKKIKAAWNPTVAEDLTSHYGIDVVEEINKIMQVELDKAIIKELRRLSRVPVVTGKIRKLPK